MKEYAPLSVSVKRDQGTTLLFSGVITSLKVSGEGQFERIFVEAKSISLLMDLKKKSRSFQDVSMTYEQLASRILRDYPGSDMKMLLPDQALREISVQYRETDCEFL